MCGTCRSMAHGRYLPSVRRQRWPIIDDDYLFFAFWWFYFAARCRPSGCGFGLFYRRVSHFLISARQTSVSRSIFSSVGHVEVKERPFDGRHSSKAHGNFKDEEMMPVGSESFRRAARLRSSFPFGLMTNDGSRLLIAFKVADKRWALDRPPADQTRPSAAALLENLGHVTSPQRHQPADD